MTYTFPETWEGQFSFSIELCPKTGELLYSKKRLLDTSKSIKLAAAKLQS